MVVNRAAGVVSDVGTGGSANRCSGRGGKGYQRQPASNKVNISCNLTGLPKVPIAEDPGLVWAAQGALMRPPAPSLHK